MDTRKKLSYIARAGYLSRGWVYLISGGFTLLAAYSSTEPKGTKGSLRVLLNAPFGRILLGLTVIGLILYSIWRFTQSVKDTDDHGMGPKGVAVRGGLFISSITHLSLAYWAMKLIEGSAHDDMGSKDWVSFIMEQSWGPYAIMFVSIGVLGAGIAHISKGVKAGFMKYFKTKPSTKLKYFCQFGLISKGVAFIGVAFLFYQVSQSNLGHEEAKLKSSLELIQNLAFGEILLLTMGLGLIAFGIYSMIESKYRKVEL